MSYSSYLDLNILEQYSVISLCCIQCNKAVSFVWKLVRIKEPCLLTVYYYLSADAVYVLCYSLILLSIDLSSPHVKNKMSKREFIRNTRRAAHNVSDDFVGHLYDNIYLIGHVAA